MAYKIMEAKCELEQYSYQLEHTSCYVNCRWYNVFIGNRLCSLNEALNIIKN